MDVYDFLSDAHCKIGIQIIKFPSPGDLTNPGIEHCLPHCRQILYQLSHKGSPRIWSGFPIPSPADFPDPGIKPESPALQADSLPTDIREALNY